MSDHDAERITEPEVTTYGNQEITEETVFAGPSASVASAVESKTDVRAADGRKVLGVLTGRN